VSALPFLLPLMFQAGFGWSPVKSGLLVMCVFVGNIGIKPITTPSLRRFGFRTVLVVSGIGLAATVLACAFLSRGTPLVVIAVLLVFSGAFRSVGFSAYNTVAYADADGETLSHVNTLMSTLQQLMGALGIAVAAIAVRAGGAIAHSADLGGMGRPYQLAFALIAILMLFAIADAGRLDAHAGASIGARSR
jgi:MFS family permease